MPILESDHSFASHLGAKRLSWACLSTAAAARFSARPPSGMDHTGQHHHSLVVGVDLVHVPDVAESLARFGERYVRRVFTDEEIAYCTAGIHAAHERFAARFAAKEAVLKVLRPDPTEAIPWRELAVRRAPEGWTEIVLSGAARDLAARQGIGPMSLSMSHEREYAMATVVAHRTSRASKLDPAVGDLEAVPRFSKDHSRGEPAVEELIRSIVREHGRLSVDVDSLTSDASLYQAGLTSHASVNLMLALEDRFGIEFPERLLRRRTFETIAGISSAVSELTDGSIGAA